MSTVRGFQLLRSTVFLHCPRTALETRTKLVQSSPKTGEPPSLLFKHGDFWARSPTRGSLLARFVEEVTKGRKESTVDCLLKVLLLCRSLKDDTRFRSSSQR